MPVEPVQQKERSFRIMLSLMRWEMEHNAKRLRDYSGRNFDYAGFCRGIDESDRLTAAEKSQARKIFNPEKHVVLTQERLEPVIRWGQSISRIFIHGDGYSSAIFKPPLPADAAFVQLWHESYQEALGEHAAYLKTYKPVKMCEAKGRNTSGSGEGGLNYPYDTPLVRISDSSGCGAAAGGNPPGLYVERGFMEKPEALKRTLLYHEASHELEPLRAGMSPKTYGMFRKYMSRVTLRAFERGNENKADALAGKLGDGHVLAQEFGRLREAGKAEYDAFISEIRNRVATLRTVAEIAFANGFALSYFDYKLDEHTAMTAAPEERLGHITARGMAKAGDAVLGFLVRQVIERDILFNTASKAVDLYHATHPRPQDRQNNLQRIEWEKRVGKKPHNPLGLSK